MIISESWRVPGKGEARIGGARTTLCWLSGVKNQDGKTIAWHQGLVDPSKESIEGGKYTCQHKQPIFRFTFPKL